MNPLLLFLIGLYILPIDGEFVSMCYFTNWAFERPHSAARFSVKNIDPTLCSHLIYAFVDIDSKNLVLKAHSHFEASRYTEFNNIKLKNRVLKTLASVGGQNAKSKAFSLLTSSRDNIAHFAKTSAKFLRDHGFDGLDVDWEYPNKATKENFTALLSALRKEFELEAEESRKERLLLTIAVPAGKIRIHEGYEAEKISKYVDYFNIMAYDYFGSWNKISGFNSPLYARKSNTMFSPEYNMKWTVDEWLSLKVPRQKIVVGMTGAGSSFTLNDTQLHDVGSPVDDGGEEGELYKFTGRLVYPEICQLADKGGKIVFDKEQQVPYLYLDDLWVGFDNVQSIKAKVKWIIREGFGGSMFWTLDLDDFSGKFCKEGKSPLLNAMKSELSKHNKKTVYKEVPVHSVKSGNNAGSHSVSSHIVFINIIATFLFVKIFTHIIN